MGAAALVPPSRSAPHGWRPQCVIIVPIPASLHLGGPALRPVRPRAVPEAHGGRPRPRRLVAGAGLWSGGASCRWLVGPWYPPRMLITFVALVALLGLLVFAFATNGNVKTLGLAVFTAALAAILVLSAGGTPIRIR